MLPHEELKAKMLENSAVRAKYERLDREDFALLHEMLAARRNDKSQTLQLVAKAEKPML